MNRGFLGALAISAAAHAIALWVVSSEDRPPVFVPPQPAVLVSRGEICVECTLSVASEPRPETAPPAQVQRPEPEKKFDPPNPPEVDKKPEPQKPPEKKVEPPKPPEKKVEPRKPPEKKVEPPKPPEKKVEPPKPPKLVKKPEPPKPPEKKVEPPKPPKLVKKPEPPKPPEKKVELPTLPRNSTKPDTVETLPQPASRPSSPRPPGVRTDLRIKGNAKPDYPYDARVRGQEGEVIVAVEVNGKGRVVNVRLHKSSGYRLLDDSALRFIETAEYVHVNSGKREAGSLLQQVRFRLVD